MRRPLLAALVLAALPSCAVAKHVAHTVAKGIPFATNVTFDPAGGMWVTSGAGASVPADGVWYVPKGGKPRHVIKHLTTALGLRWYANKLYVSHIVTPSRGRVSVFWGFTGRRFRHRGIALDHLTIGRHTVDSIVPHAGRLYVGVGSTGDNSGFNGRVLSWKPGRHKGRLEAGGLRNPFGLAFSGSRLFVTDNARDDLGAFRPPEELDAFNPAGPVVDFGWPGCYDQGGAACRGKVAPFAKLPAHASSDGLAIKGHVAFVAENGSSFSSNRTGSDVQRVDLRTHKVKRFWRAPQSHDPLGAAIGPDGDLYVTLFVSGKVVRFDV